MQDLKVRYKLFTISAATLIQRLPKNTVNTAYSNQLIRSASSPGTNYRAACRRKSLPDFINKLKIVKEELDESIYFSELLEHFNSERNPQLTTLIKEANELLAITVKSIQTARTKSRKQLEL